MELVKYKTGSTNYVIVKNLANDKVVIRPLNNSGREYVVDRHKLYSAKNLSESERSVYLKLTSPFKKLFTPSPINLEVVKDSFGFKTINF